MDTQRNDKNLCPNYCSDPLEVGNIIETRMVAAKTDLRKKPYPTSVADPQ